MHRDLILVINEFLYCVKCICHIGNTESLRTCKVIYSASLFQCLSSLDTVINHTCKKRQRCSLRMCHINGIVSINKQCDRVIHLCFISIIEFIKCLHILNITCLWANLYTLVHTI